MSHKYYPHISGLRAIAVLAVIIYHYFPQRLMGGFSGVDVFFVISGFVVTGSVANLKRISFGHFMARFYARRILRIVPALLVCLLITIVLTSVFIPHAWLSTSIDDTAKYAFFGLSNFRLMSSGDNYFAPRSEFNPFTHTWSLGIEEQFYFLFPALFFLWSARFSLRKPIQDFIRPIFLILVLFSFGLSVFFTKTDPLVAFYSLPTRFWELGAGVLLFLSQQIYPQLWKPKGKILPLLVGCIALLTILTGFAFLKETRFPFPGALLPVVGTLGLLWALQTEKQISYLKSFLESRPVVFIGNISYSLYLWHWPFLILLKWTYGADKPIHLISALALAFFCINKFLLFHRESVSK